MPALARRTDPATSHQATRAAHRSTAKDDVLRILTDHGPLNDSGIEEIHDLYVARGLMPHRSPQRLRTARAELERAGAVTVARDTAGPLTVRMPSGYSSNVWKAVR